jgi:hypothetical protein
MTTAYFRKLVKTNFPHVTIKIKTVSFEDLARASKQSLKISGEKNAEETAAINGWAKDAGILPDGNIKSY